MNAQPHPCLVIPITFRPYAETGEFACFGVLLHCAETGFIGYKIGDHDRRVTDRINNFFKEIGRDIFRMTLKSAKRDLEQVANAPSDLFVHNQTKTLLDNLVRPREHLIRYGDPMAVMTDDPVAELNRQYALIVERGFVDQEGHYENEVRFRVKRVLESRRIPYSQYSFHDASNYVFTLPFSFDAKSGGKKAIKALNLAGTSVTDIIDNGLKWEYRIKQLLENGFRRNDLLVPVNLAVRNPDNQAAVLNIFDKLTNLVPTVDSRNLDSERDALIRFTEDAVSA